MGYDILDESNLGRGRYEPAAALLEREDSLSMTPPSQLRRSRRAVLQEPHLNITSFVDVLAVLMFFLLTVATLEKLGKHEVALPAESGAFAPESEVEVKNLTVALARDGLRLRGLLVPASGEPEVLDLELPIVQSGESYDVARLREELLRLKATYETDDAIILMVGDDVHFDWIVKIMDAVREKVEYRAGEQIVTRLFPEVSLSDYLLDFDPEAPETESSGVAADATADAAGRGAGVG